MEHSELTKIHKSQSEMNFTEVHREIRMGGREQMNKPHIRLSHWKLNHLENHSFGIVRFMKSVHMTHREK